MLSFGCPNPPAGTSKCITGVYVAELSDHPATRESHVSSRGKEMIEAKLVYSWQGSSAASRRGSPDIARRSRRSSCRAIINNASTT